jgi:hypothetical protein
MSKFKYNECLLLKLHYSISNKKTFKLVLKFLNVIISENLLDYFFLRIKENKLLRKETNKTGSTFAKVPTTMYIFNNIESNYIHVIQSTVDPIKIHLRLIVAMDANLF